MADYIIQWFSEK